jgi:hypothetical protein
MTTPTLSKKTSRITFKLVFVALSAIALMGCAQFEDSFGELRNPESSWTASRSNSEDSARSDDHSDHASNRIGDATSANASRSFTIGGIRVAIADSKTD